MFSSLKFPSSTRPKKWPKVSNHPARTLRKTRTPIPIAVKFQLRKTSMKAKTWICSMTFLAQTMTLMKFNLNLNKSNVKTRQTMSCNNWNTHPKKVARQSKDTWVLIATRTCALVRSKSQTASAKSSFTPGCAKCQTMFTSGSFTVGKPKSSVAAFKLSWAFSTFQGRVSLKIGKR